MSDVHSVQERVTLLKQQKQQVKRMKQNIKVSDFHNSCSQGPTAKADTKPKAASSDSSGRRKRRRKLRRDATDNSASLVSEADILSEAQKQSSVVPESAVATDEAASSDGIMSLSVFAKDLERSRTKSMDKIGSILASNQCMDVQDGYALVAKAEQAGLKGRGEEIAGNLERHLSQANVCDRWMTDNGVEMTPAERQQVSKHVKEWTNEGVPRLPADYRSRVDLFHNQTYDARSRHDDIGTPVSKEYISQFLVTPRRSLGQRSCAAGAQCQGNLMYQRSWVDREQSELLQGASKTLREYLTPAESARFAQKGELPKQRQFCVVCERFVVSMMCKFRTVHNCNAKMVDWSGQLGRHTVLVDQENEYDSQNCLYSESPIAGVPRMYLCHRDSHYVYNVSKISDGSTEVRLTETGVGYEERLN